MPSPGLEALSAFLNSIPGLSQRLERVHEFPGDETEGDREVISAMLLEVVKRSLRDEARSGTETWISELADFNYSSKDGIDDAEFVTKLVLDHAIERPWILEAPFMHNAVSILETREHRPPDLHMYGLCMFHDDCNSLKSLALRHGSVPDSFSGPRAKEFLSVAIPQLLDNPKSEQLMFAVDSYLGIAGVLPISIRGLHLARPHGVQMVDSNTSATFKSVFLREFRDHVKFGHPFGDGSKCSARVSFQAQNTNQTRQLLQPNDVELELRILIRISTMVRQLECALARCQENGQCLFGIPFLKRDISSIQLLDDEVLSLEILSTKAVKRFTLAFKELERAWANHRRLDFKYFGVLGVLFFELVFTTGLAGILALLFLVYSYWTTWWRTQEAIKNLLKALTDVFRVVGLDFTGFGFTGLDQSGHRSEVLHYSSLAVQCMSLALQSSVRRLSLPMKFSFLENSVTEFILEGTNVGEQVIATMQQPTCLAGMLGHAVMVFGRSPYISPVRLDIEMTLQDMLSVWGPGELSLIRHENDAQSYDVAEVHIGGGRLRPHEDSQSLPRIWHWEPVDRYNGPFSVDHQSQKKLVDINTRIRIGVSNTTVPTQASVDADPPERDCTGYPGSFVPIGPCRLNISCVHANAACDVKRRALMLTSRFYKDLGTHGAYNQFVGFDIGAQVGQYVGGQAVGRWDSSPAWTAKDALLDTNQSPVELIKKLDKTCGLLVSSCTRVMSRARLRDLVALAGPLLNPGLFPCLDGLDPDKSRATIVQALRGNDQFLTWASAQLDDTGRPLRDSNEFKQLVLSVLRTLGCTGIRPTKMFEVAWISPSPATKAIQTPCDKNSWLYFFEDGPNTATFACVTPLCLETEQLRCTGLQDVPHPCSLIDGLGSFVLSTSVILLLGEHAGPEQTTQRSNLTLQIGRRYFLDSITHNIVAKVRERSGSEYVVRLKEHNIIEGLLYRIVIKGDGRFIRESMDDEAISCLVSSML
jgi:hypothetical protein